MQDRPTEQFHRTQIDAKPAEASEGTFSDALGFKMMGLITAAIGYIAGYETPRSIAMGQEYQPLISPALLLTITGIAAIAIAYQDHRSHVMAGGTQEPDPENPYDPPQAEL